MLFPHLRPVLEDVGQQFPGEGGREVQAFRVQVGIEVLQAQEVPVRGEVRLDPGKEETVFPGGLTEVGRASLGQGEQEANHRSPDDLA